MSDERVPEGWRTFVDRHRGWAEDAARMAFESAPLEFETAWGAAVSAHADGLDVVTGEMLDDAQHFLDRAAWGADPLGDLRRINAALGDSG